ncbi:SGNH/GDSL hydrolase family protein [Lederbergia sp. NSJ-179]|uniref:SGNH/GDSL hydrolase family protein n=1 Tax=Lederbergia sp. NSJ-179 TaxID=2931402 RepID=UPI001FCFBD91|nr:SGNH/GDSL hydrolase family protein [Lederbergia sp. NSJ-179]MCJ7842245.1 SGNH/GDSL hydrolase family protein [Lederbergia sp. NSJ-179]
MEKNSRILLIGDSITDTGRREDPEGLGFGYVRLIHDELLVTYPEKNIEIINRGIGGDRVTNLQARWDEDVLSEEPDYVSISIGINDVWRQLDQPQMEQVYPEQFEEIYHELCQKTKAQLILMEPTVIEEDLDSEGNRKLVDYVEIVRRLAKQYHAILVPTHQDFQYYLLSGNEHPLTTDGVHMNSAGNMLMARSWMKACAALF